MVRGETSEPVAYWQERERAERVHAGHATEQVWRHNLLQRVLPDEVESSQCGAADEAASATTVWVLGSPI